MKKLTTLSKTIFVMAFLKIVFILSLILSLTLWSIPILSFNSGIWSIFQERSGVALDPEGNAEAYNKLIVKFLREGVGLDFLTEQELSHMEDVRTVVVITTILFIVSFLAIISNFSYFVKSDRKFLLKIIRKVSLFVFVFTLIVLIIVMTNFYNSFLVFHKVLFIRNFIFPADSILKILYPDKFFLGLSAFYLISIMIVSFVVAVVSHKLKLK